MKINASHKYSLIIFHAGDWNPQEKVFSDGSWKEKAHNISITDGKAQLTGIQDNVLYVLQDRTDPEKRRFLRPFTHNQVSGLMIY